jgi:hypothetical protein
MSKRRPRLSVEEQLQRREDQLQRRVAGRIAMVQARYQRDREHREFAARGTQPEAASPRRRPVDPPPSPVVVQTTDGTQQIHPPLDAKALQRIVRMRAISPAMRRRVTRRDKGMCRYCGTAAGPFEIDHVLPVSLGGGNALRNLVLACDSCNRRKGASVWTPRRLPQ